MRHEPPSLEQRARDRRLAWILVGVCAVVTLGLVTGALLLVRGSVARWAEEAGRQPPRPVIVNDGDGADDEDAATVPAPPPASGEPPREDGDETATARRGPQAGELQKQGEHADPSGKTGGTPGEEDDGPPPDAPDDDGGDDAPQPQPQRI